MDITPQIPESAFVINGYSHRGFVVNGREMNGSILITPSDCRVISIDSVAALSGQILNELLSAIESSTEILLIGTGQQGCRLPREITQALSMNFETMATGAACRTYNILMAEGRQVAALLIIE